MRWLLELLSVCDYISPAIGMAQDVNHAITGSHPTMTIQVDKGYLHQAKKILGNAVVSTNTVAFDSMADITIECYGGEDGYGSVRDAVKELNRKGIHAEVYPPWA